jgi:hypothetical protein
VKRRNLFKGLFATGIFGTLFALGSKEAKEVETYKYADYIRGNPKWIVFDVPYGRYRHENKIDERTGDEFIKITYVGV